MGITQVVVIHVGAGVERAQGAVERQRAGREALVDALADLHLHEVARGDELFGAVHRGQVIVFGKAALRGVAGARRHGRRLCRRLEAQLQLGQTRLCLSVSTGLGRVGVHDERELAREVVDDRELLGLQEQDIGHAQIVGRARVHQLFLDVAHRVVTKIARQATTKAGQARAQRHLEALLVSRHKIQWVAGVGFHHLAIGHDLGLGGLTKPAGAQERAGGQADEAVATKTLATDDRLQQKAVLATVLHVGEFEVEGQWRL